MDANGKGLDDIGRSQDYYPPPPKLPARPVLIGKSGNQPVFRIDGKIVVQIQ